MSEKNNSARSGGIGFLGLLTLLFIGLKLGGAIDWSWWWVLAPMWGPLALLLGLSAFFFTVAGICLALAKMID